MPIQKYRLTKIWVLSISRQFQSKINFLKIYYFKTFNQITRIFRNLDLLKILYPICDSNQQNKFGNTPIMEAALALEMKDSEFIEIIKLGIKFDTNLRAVFP